MAISVSVYECVRGVKRVSTLSKEDIANGSKLGVLPAAVSMLVSDKHLEFAVVLEGKRGQESTIWMGFHFYGQLENIQRCFRKKVDDLRTIGQLLHTSLVSKPSEPYSCPILVIGENSNKAFWQVSVEPNYSDILGYIPLLRTEFFHTIKSYPIIFSEGSENSGVIVVGDVDRNHLLPSNPNLDEAFTTLLKKIKDVFGEQQWWYVLEGLRSEKKKEKNSCPSHLEYICKWIVKKAEKSNPPTLVGNASIWRKGAVKDVQVVSLSTSATGKSQFTFLIQSFDIMRRLGQVFQEEDNNNVDNDHEKISLERVDNLLDDIVDDIKGLKNITHQGTAIYNPFFERMKGVHPAFVLDNHHLGSNSGQITRCDLPISKEFLKTASLKLISLDTEEKTTPITPTTSTSSTSTTSIPAEKKSDLLNPPLSPPSHDLSNENTKTLTTQFPSLNINQHQPQPQGNPLTSVLQKTSPPRNPKLEDENTDDDEEEEEEEEEDDEEFTQPQPQPQPQQSNSNTLTNKANPSTTSTQSTATTAPLNFQDPSILSSGTPITQKQAHTKAPPPNNNDDFNLIIAKSLAQALHKYYS